MADPTGRIRVLAIARQPLQVEDFGLHDQDDIDIVQLVRRPGEMGELVEEVKPDVVLVDTSFAHGASFTAITEIAREAPSAGILALTPDPPPHEDVARAIRAGASGFVDTNAEPHEFVAAIRSVWGSDPWLPGTQTQAVLRDVADDLDVTTADRKSRLTAMTLGLIPLAGILAGILSLLYRKYLGQIGVRPVDIAIDPGTRVADAVSAILFVLGFFGPFLFIRSWLELLRESVQDHPRLRWVVARPKLAGVVLFLLVLAAVVFLTLRADLILILFVGPAVLVALIAVALDLTSTLPRFLQLRRFRPERAIVGALAITFVFLTILSVETLVRGPNFGSRGVEGVLLHRVIGFRPKPVLVINVDGAREPREALYLGGNADLYVLVDPCDDDKVEYVSVGQHRLEVIEEVTCPDNAG